MSLTRWIGLAGLALLLVVAAPWSHAAESDPTQDRGSSADSRDARSAAYAHMMRAVMAARRGEFGAASTEIQNALDAQPNDPDLLVQAAELQSWTGRAVQAEKLARRAVEIDPDHMEALKFLGDLLLARALATASERVFQVFGKPKPPVSIVEVQMCVHDNYFSIDRAS